MLRESGVGKRALARKVAEGTLHRIHRGIFVEGKVDAAAVARALVVGLVRIAFTGKTASEIFLGKRLTFPLEAEGPRTIAGPGFKVTRSRPRGEPPRRVASHRASMGRPEGPAGLRFDARATLPRQGGAAATGAG